MLHLIGVAFLIPTLAPAGEIPVAPPPRAIRVDAVGDRLPPGAVARLGTSRLRHTGAVRDLAFNPEGTRLAVTSDDGSASVWDSDTGRLVGRADVGSGAAVQFAPDGGVGTFTLGGGLRVFDADAAKIIRSKSSDRPVGGRNVAAGRQPAPVLSHGLRWMAYEEYDRNRGSRVVVVDPATDRETAALPTRHNGWVTRVGFSADGTRLVVGDGESARFTLWVLDAPDGKVVFEHRVEGLYPHVVSLSKDGQRVAAIGLPHDGGVTAAARVWDVASGKLLLDIPVNRNYHLSAALAPDGKTLAVLEQRTISFVDVGTGKATRSLGTRWENGRLVFSPDGRKLAVAPNSNAVEVFDLASERVVPDRGETFDLDFRYSAQWGSFRFRPDGRLLAFHADDTGVWVWETLLGRRVEPIALPPGGRWIHELFPDGRRLIYSAGKPATVGEFRVWDRDRKEDVATSDFSGVVGPEFRFTPDGRLFLHPDFIYVSPPEVWKPQVWELDPTTLKRKGRWILPNGPFCPSGMWGGRHVSADGRYRFEVSADAQGRPRGTIRQWDVTRAAEGAVIRWAPEETLSDDMNRIGEVRGLWTSAVSGDGRWVAVYQFIGRRREPNAENRDRVFGEDFISVFDATDGRERIRFPVRKEPWAGGGTGTPVLSPDGRLVAVALRGECRLYEMASGTERRRMGRPSGDVSRAAFSPNGRLLVTYDVVNAGLVWDIHAPAPDTDPDTLFRAGGMKSAWDALAAPSAAAAYPAIVWLASRGDEAVQYLGKAVRPAPVPTPEQVAAWVSQLDASFEEREVAEQQLRWVAGNHAVRFGDALRKAAATTDSPEVAQRLRRVLAAMDRFEPLPEELRAARAVEVLERIGSPAARAVLANLAQGPAEAWLTRDAIAALARVRRP